jgi:hypothetical protein
MANGVLVLRPMTISASVNTACHRTPSTSYEMTLTACSWVGMNGSSVVFGHLSPVSKTQSVGGS